MTQYDEDCVYLDYLLRRLSAFPSVWWSLGNEYDLCKKSIAHWEQLEEYIANHDPYHHLLSCHNALRLWDHSRPNITHVSIQSKALWRVNAWRQQYCKPVIIDEFGYEGNFPHTWGCLSAKELVSRFWRCCTTGAYGSHGETLSQSVHRDLVQIAASCRLVDAPIAEALRAEDRDFRIDKRINFFDDAQDFLQLLFRKTNQKGLRKDGNLCS